MAFQRAGLGFFLVPHTLCLTASYSKSSYWRCCSWDILPHPFLSSKQMVSLVRFHEPPKALLFPVHLQIALTPPGPHSDCSVPPKPLLVLGDVIITPDIVLFSSLGPPCSCPPCKLEQNELGFWKHTRKETCGCYFFFLPKHLNSCRCSVLYMKGFQSQWDWWTSSPLLLEANEVGQYVA